MRRTDGVLVQVNAWRDERKEGNINEWYSRNNYMCCFCYFVRGSGDYYTVYRIFPHFFQGTPISQVRDPTLSRQRKKILASSQAAIVVVDFALYQILKATVRVLYRGFFKLRFACDSAKACCLRPL